MRNSQSQIAADLRSVFACVPLYCLMHLRANMHRLIRGVYSTPDGRFKCLMALLTELLPEGERIESKRDLTRFFGTQEGQPGEPGFVHPRDSESYQPARWLVRLWDNQPAPRYGEKAHLTTAFLEQVLDDCIRQRAAIEAAEAAQAKKIPAASP